MSYETTYHNDGSVTLWNCLQGSWQRTSRPSDNVLATLSKEECERVMRHCGIYRTVCDRTVQVDHSGQGHSWRPISSDDLPANITEEIECEILDGGNESCDDYIASNGLHYRW